MKKNLNWQSKEIVNIFDEVSLWSAPFGRLLLENIPMQQELTIVDIGFGAGFPLIELSQRFGDSAKIYGIDIWKEAIKRTRTKIDLLEITNIEILEESAINIKLPDNHIDLITSNLGINNFEDREKVYAEIHRILKQDGSLCITTNPVGTFEELFELFGIVFTEMKLQDELRKLKNSIEHRKTKASIVQEFKQNGFKAVNSKFDTTNMRFSNALALFNHSLIRIGFREYWEAMIRSEMSSEFFERLIQKIESIIKTDGEFKMTIPMLYLEFKKEG